MNLGTISALAGLSALDFGANAFSSAISSKKSFEYAERLAAQQFEYNKKMMQNRHQWQVADLRAAGLNPILSANSGAAGSTSSGGSVNVSPPEADFSGNLRSAISLSDQLKNSRVQRQRVATEAAVSAERLKQEKLKTDYIKKDPTYFTPSKSFADVARGLLFPSASKLKDLKNSPIKGMPDFTNLRNLLKSAWELNKRLTPVYNFYQYNRHDSRHDSRFDKSIEGSEFLKSGGRR